MVRPVCSGAITPLYPDIVPTVNGASDPARGVSHTLEGLNTAVENTKLWTPKICCLKFEVGCGGLRVRKRVQFQLSEGFRKIEPFF